MAGSRGAVRYHVPRDRSPVPAVLVGALVVLTLVSAQLTVAGEPSRVAPGGTAAAPAVTAAPDRGPGTAEASPAPAASPVTTRAEGLPPPVEVAFDVGSDAPSAEAEERLGPVVEALLADPARRVRVVGHAAASNDPVLEEQLSLRRAEAVLALLLARGIPQGRADVVGAGATEAGRSAGGTDRRVTVEVVEG